MLGCMSLETMLAQYGHGYIAQCEAIHGLVGIVSGFSITLLCLLLCFGPWGSCRILTTFGQDWRERHTLISSLLVGSSLALTSHWLADTMQWGW